MISASIVTYQNKPEILSRTINSYLAATENSKLFVVDNSPEDSARSLCSHPRVEYIFNKRNLGYGSGHNIVLRDAISQSKYHLVLNPDVFFSTEVIYELISYLEAHADVGLIMPKVLYMDGRLQPLCKLLPRPLQLIARRFSPDGKVLEKVNFEYEMHFTGYNQITEAPFLSGCFMMLRTEALKQVGLFDERFFLYFEDTDLSRRINALFKTIYYPHVNIYHIHERAPYKTFKHLYYSIRSAVKYFNKWGWLNDVERESVNNNILIRHAVNGYRKRKD